MTRNANKKKIFLEKLPEKFTHSEYVKIAKELGLAERTAEKYMGSFVAGNLIRKDQRDEYTNLSIT